MGDNGEAKSASRTPIFEYAARCRIIRKIAEGGMGSVYLAEQIGEVGFAKTVALKVIKKERLEDERAVRLFLDEARLVADLVHQNILQVYNLASYRGMYFIVMEFLHGVTARDFLVRHTEEGRLPPVDLAAFIVSRVCRGLAYAHDKRDRKGQPLGIVHRDVTPTNIMLDFRGFVKLSDFGIAKALTMSIPDETKVIMGKFPYMSPEHAMARPTDQRSDIFSLGLVLYELLTGRRILEVRNRKELLKLFETAAFVPPDERRPVVPRELADICMRALEIDPADRYQSAREFGNALEVYMYATRYGPTNEKLAEYLNSVFPEVDRDRIE